MNYQHIKGLIGEILTMFYLLLSFNKIIKWRYASKYGEIDLITIKNNTITFYEIKTRFTSKIDHDNCKKMVTYKQINRIRQSAENFTAKNSKYHNHDYNIKIVVVSSFFKPPLILEI